MVPVTVPIERVWSEQDTTPGAHRGGAARLLDERHAQSDAFVPARVLNLVVIADREWRGEIQNRLERVGRYHPSRTILCAVEPRAARRSTRGWPSRPRADHEGPASCRRSAASRSCSTWARGTSRASTRSSTRSW